MNRVLRSILEYLAVTTLIILLLLTITGVVAVKFYGDDLKIYAIEQVNQKLDTQVEVDSLELSVFRKFPHMTLSLHHVCLWSSHNFSVRDFPGPGADTLLYAERVNASFHLLALFRGRYQIRQLEAEKGQLHIYTDQHTEGNYKVIAKSDRDSDSKGDLDLNIAELKLKDFLLLVNNQKIDFQAEFQINALDLNGRVARNDILLRTSLEGHLDRIANKDMVFASDREISSRISLDVNDSLFTINDGHIQIGRIEADVNGSFTTLRGRGVNLDIHAAARNLEIHEVLDLLPSEISSSLNEIKGKGRLEMDTRVFGMAGASETPTIEADFKAANANLEWGKLPFTLNNMDLTGSYSNGGEFNPATTTLSMDSFRADIGEDDISLRGSIHNFLDPAFNLEIRGLIHPQQWENWFSDFPLHDCDGSVVSDLLISGKIDRDQSGGEKLLSFDLQGDLEMEDLKFRLPGSKVAFDRMNGSISIRNDLWEPDLSGIYGVSDFLLQASGRNLLSFLLGREEVLIASGTLRSEKVDLDEIFSSFSKTSGKNKHALSLTENLQLHLDFVINELGKKEFQVRQLRGVASYDAPLLRLDSLHMQGMSGSLKGDGSMLYNPETGASMQVNASLYQLDIQELFYAFNNFGQKELTHENLKGKISGTSMFSADFDTLFRMIPASILSENDVMIRDGELNNFGPMEALSTFIELDELQQVRFSTLQNKILIADRQIYIPSMNILSNAIDLQASGVQGFDKKYDYRISLKLSELLYKKANQEFEVREDESDKRTLFLRIQNDGSGTKVSRDKEASANKRKLDMQKEKEELKRVLNQELGLFRKQQDQVEEETEPDPKDNPSLQFEFPEEDSVKQENNERGLFKKRRKKDKEENKPASGFVLDDG